MGQTLSVRRAFAVAAISLVFAVPLSGCRKLGLDESPRQFPEGGDPSSLGPKRAPINQNSALFPVTQPQAMAQPQQPQRQPQPAPEAYDAASAYAANDGNFWASNAGWTASPPAMSAGAAAPKPQPAPLPSLDLLRRQQQPSGFASMGQGFPSSRYSGNPGFSQEFTAQQQPNPPLMPVQAQYPSGYAPPPQTMMQPTMGGDFPSLREIPGQPYYRDPNEIAADFASLQTGSPPASGYLAPTPQQPAYDPGYGQGYSGYAPAPAQAPAMMSPAAAPAPSYAPYPDAAAMPPALSYTGNGYAAAPAQNEVFYSASEFVKPAPIAGVPDAPAMTRDWDRGAYSGGGGGSAYAANTAVELRAPYGGQQPFLPESRYIGQRRAPTGYRY